MEGNQWTRTRVGDLRGASGRALFKSGMWMVVGYLGASSFVLGVERLLEGQGAPLSALAFVLAGGALAIYAWRNGYRAVDRADAPIAPPPQVRAGADRSASGLTTLIGAPEA